MDFVLIILLLVIIICMGYILCKPFIHETDDEGTAQDEVHLESQYQLALEEIKRIERDCKTGRISKEDADIQILELKNLAATLLHQITHQGETGGQIPQNNAPPTTLRNQSGTYHTGEVKKICPNCSEQIETSDKFCVHCGYTL
ncbi:MAG: zinc-ribbon domain-containing protein [Brevefilum sp.]